MLEKEDSNHLMEKEDEDIPKVIFLIMNQNVSFVEIF